MMPQTRQLLSVDVGKNMFKLGSETLVTLLVLLLDRYQFLNVPGVAKVKSYTLLFRQITHALEFIISCTQQEKIIQVVWQAWLCLWHYYITYLRQLSQ